MVQSSDPGALVQSSLNVDLSLARTEQVRIEAELGLLNTKLQLA